MSYKPRKTREVINDLLRVGFTRHSSGGNSHVKYRHECGVMIALPEFGRTVSPGIARQVEQALAEVERRVGGSVE